MAEFASRGVGGAGLGLGIAGTALGVLNGGLGNLLGGLGMTRNAGGCCAEDHLVNRYEAAQNARISQLENEVKLRDSNIYTDNKILELYTFVNNKFSNIEGQIAQQAVYNATNNATLSCLQNQVAVLQGLTKTVIPTASICPEPMARYNSWTAPTATTTT